MYLENGSYEGNAILSGISLQEITKPSIPLQHPVSYSYGMGWFVGDGDIVHDGRPTNYYSVILMEPETKRGVVLLANANNRLITAEYMMPMAYELLNALEGKASAGGFMGFRQMYRALNLLLLFMLTLPLYRFIMIFRKKYQNKKGMDPKKIVKLLIPEVINFAIILSLLLWLLNSYGVSLKIAYLGQPDIVSVMVGTLILTSINTLLKLSFFWKSR